MHITVIQNGSSTFFIYKW